MGKRMKVIYIACGVGMPILSFLWYIYSPWIILPIASSPHMLTLVKDGYPRPNQITCRNYANDVPVIEYVLELKSELSQMQPQKYMLPQVNEGRVEISIEVEDGVIHGNNSVLTIEYAQASSLYSQGLLIFLKTDYASNITIGDFVYYDQYVYFVSGIERTCYFQKAGSSEWSQITDAPPLKRFTRDIMGFSHIYSGWKENEWVVSSIDIPVP